MLPAMPMKIDQTRQNILDAPGHLLIVGGPGCGKTTIALLKAKQTLDTLKPEQRVLFLSFSRAAVRQITDRMTGLLERAGDELLEVRTFHAFFLNIIRSHGRLLTGQPASFIPPDREALLEADFDGDWKQEKRRLAAEEGRYVFDLFAGTAATLIERSSAVRDLYTDIYPLVIVDEFQDTNLDQWRVVKALSRSSTVICLADPDQRIFDHIEGVEEERIEHATAHLAPATFDLSKDNHRSPGNGLLDYANAVLRNAPHRQPENVRTITYRYGNQWQSCAHHAVVALRDHLTARLGRTPTIAVLATTNTLLGQFSESLSAERSIGNKTLPAVDHILQWDPELSAAAGHVVASIMEWPGLPPAEATTNTLMAITDLYRAKVAGGAASARSKIRSIDNAITALASSPVGPITRSTTAKAILTACTNQISFTGDPVADWQTARACLTGTADLDEILKHARRLRLLKATDELAWGLLDAWSGTAYTAAAATVRLILAAETLTSSQPPDPITLMSMHRSKGKEFDGVVIIEGKHNGRLLDPVWGDGEINAKRRLLRVAITRARHFVVFVRPPEGQQLTPTGAR